MAAIAASLSTVLMAGCGDVSSEASREGSGGTSEPAYPIVVAVSRGEMTGGMCRLLIGLANMGDVRFESLNLTAVALDQSGMPIGDGPMPITNFRPQSTVTEGPLFSNVRCSEIAEVKIEVESMNPRREMNFVGAEDSKLPISY